MTKILVRVLILAAAFWVATLLVPGDFRVYADTATEASLRSRFGYLFETPPGSYYPPILDLDQIAAGRSETIEGAGGPITALPFRVEHQRLVKDVMVNEAGRDWILRAKTGWSGKVGWWVGWVEWPTGPVFFALNIDTPNRLDDLSKRQEITRNILRSINALPPS